MVFGFGKPKNKDSFIESERSGDDERRKKFLKEREIAASSVDKPISGPKPKQSFREKLQNYKESLEVNREKKALARFKKAKEKEQAKKDKANRVKKAAEVEVYNDNLSPSERAEFERYKAEHKGGTFEKINAAADKAVEYNKKAHDAADKINNGIDKFAKAADMFMIKPPSSSDTEMNFSSPFDFNITDDNKQYGKKKAGAIQGGDPLGPFSFGGLGGGAEGYKGAKLPEGDPLGPFSFGSSEFKGLGPNGPDPLELFRVDNSMAENAHKAFQMERITQGKKDLSNMFSLTWGQRPRRTKKVKKGKGKNGQQQGDPFSLTF